MSTNRVLSAEGGAAVQTLSDAGRAVLVRRALEELQDQIEQMTLPTFLSTQN